MGRHHSLMLFVRDYSVQIVAGAAWTRFRGYKINVDASEEDSMVLGCEHFWICNR